MASFSYSVFTMFGILLIGTGLALQMLYIEKYQNDTTEYLPMQIISLIINALIVGYLVFVLMFYRPYSSPSAMGAMTLLLILGLTAETFIDQFGTNKAGQVFSYMLAAINALIRLYLLIQVRCASELTTIPELFKEIVNVAEKTGKPVSQIQKQLGVEPGTLDTLDPKHLWENFNTVINRMKFGDDEDTNRSIRSKLRDETRTSVFGIKPKQPVGGRR